ncbi:MAG: hypothetical protein EOP40_19125, partial [Rubrivivax sp.]
DDFRQMVKPMLRGTALGSALGVLPGGGAILASFASYSMEKKLAAQPQRRAQRRAPQHRLDHLAEVVSRGHEATDRAHFGAAGAAHFEVAEDLADAEETHGHGHEFQAVGEFGQAEGEAFGAAVQILSHGAEQHPEHQHGQRLHHRTLRQRDRGDQAQHHECEVFG